MIILLFIVSHMLSLLFKNYVILYGKKIIGFVNKYIITKILIMNSFLIANLFLDLPLPH